MIIRVLLAVSEGMRKRFESLLAFPHVLVEEVYEGEFRAFLANNFTGVNAELMMVQSDWLPADLSPLHDALTQRDLGMELLVISPYEDAAARAKLLAAGSIAVLFSGLPDESLKKIVETVLVRIQRTVTGKDQLRQFDDPLNKSEDSSDNFPTALTAHETPPGWKPLSQLASVSPSMQRFLEIAGQLTRSNTSVLLLGETGVGKETIARGIHLESQRKDQPFIAVNCAGLHENLLESQLFGHERGAFTGADRAHRGAFELAHGGTILLDEIGDMPLTMQTKLLRVLQDKSFRRIGAEKELPVDFRIMAATNADLQNMIAQKHFREDLFYRLAVVSLTIPPLRQRSEDIPFLANGYIKLFSHQMGRVVHGLSYEALQALLRYPWPGNVRELVNVIERAVLLTRGRRITPADISFLESNQSITIPTVDTESEQTPGWKSWVGNQVDKPWHEARQEALASFERAYLDRLLRETNGQVGLASRRAGLNPRTLYNKMRQFGLSKEEYRGPSYR